jgi:hypothetical protein
VNRALILVSFVAVAGTAPAETMGKTAEWFMDYCAGQLHVKTTEAGEEYTGWSSLKGSYCAGYLSAASDGSGMLLDGRTMLGRDILNFVQLTWIYAITAEYLSRHPELLQARAFYVIQAALKEQAEKLDRRRIAPPSQ